MSEASFVNPMRPTEEELLAWARDPLSVEPEIEWDLLLSGGIYEENLPIYIRLASDTSSPKWEYFLHLLYLWAERVVRSDSFAFSKQRWLRALHLAGGKQAPVIRTWRHRTRLIFEGVKPFDYDAWWDEYMRDRRAWTESEEAE